MSSKKSKRFLKFQVNTKQIQILAFIKYRQLHKESSSAAERIIPIIITVDEMISAFSLVHLFLTNWFLAIRFFYIAPNSIFVLKIATSITRTSGITNDHSKKYKGRTKDKPVSNYNIEDVTSTI